MKNLLFIPCYCCEKQITRTLQSIDIQVSEFFSEILVIDNISSDNTYGVAKMISEHHVAASKIRVVQNPQNIGLGGTHKLAFDYAVGSGFDNIVVLHGDDQGNINDFVPILKNLGNQSDPAYIMGARFHLGSRLNGYSFVRIIGNVLFNFIASISTFRFIWDLGGSGLNLFPVSLIKAHKYRAYANDLTFHIFLLLNAFKLNQKVQFVPVSWSEDDQISNVKLFSQAKKVMSLVVKHVLLKGRLISEKPLEESVVFQHWNTSRLKS